MARPIQLLVFLSALLASLVVSSASIEPGDTAAVLELHGLSPKDKRIITAPLFDFSPFSADNKTVVPGFADPLGAGVDPGLRVFSGKVHFMDILGNFRVKQTDGIADVELPPDALKGIDLLDNFLAVYLSYDGRAYDRSILNIGGAEVTERNGLPVTAETSPLSLAGYGSVSENLQPRSLHWTRCPDKEKRLRSMEKSMKRQQWPCAVPAVCQCYVI
jgi:hypothetical protein